MKATNAKRGRRHDLAVDEIAKWYRSTGCRVEAALADWPRPENISGRIPDVVLHKDGKKWIIEVETPESTGTPPARDQYVEFETAAMESPDHVFFHLCLIDESNWPDWGLNGEPRP